MFYSVYLLHCAYMWYSKLKVQNLESKESIERNRYEL